jgi:hypothetical protein
VRRTRKQYATARIFRENDWLLHGRTYDNQREIRHAATIGLRAATGPSA